MITTHAQCMVYSSPEVLAVSVVKEASEGTDSDTVVEGESAEGDQDEYELWLAHGETDHESTVHDSSRPTNDTGNKDSANAARVPVEEPVNQKQEHAEDDGGTRTMHISELEILAASDNTIPFCRPCVECGLITGNFCDGGITCKYDECLAANRISTEQWNKGQRTPLCTHCEARVRFCRFCRGVHGCTPFTKEKATGPSEDEERVHVEFCGVVITAEQGYSDKHSAVRTLTSFQHASKHRDRVQRVDKRRALGETKKDACANDEKIRHTGIQGESVGNKNCTQCGTFQRDQFLSKEACWQKCHTRCLWKEVTLLNASETVAKSSTQLSTANVPQSKEETELLCFGIEVDSARNSDEESGEANISKE